MVFTSIGHLINKELLKSCHESMDKDKAVGIQKPNGKMRPLSIYCYEDKLLQEALRRILEAVFEPHFYEEMMGFRPNRGCHKALKLLNRMIENNNTSYVLDADIKGFFDSLNHEWIIKFVESRIKDPNIIRLIRRMLKAGIMKDYCYEIEESGSGQGGLCRARHKPPYDEIDVMPSFVQYS